MTVPARPPTPDAVDHLVLRSMTERDLDAVADIERLAAPEPWSRSHFADELRLPGDSRCWLVADTGGPSADLPALIGFGGIMLVADEAHIMDVAVHPEFQGRGVGRRIVARLLSAAVRGGARAATLEVRPDNEAALGLYRRLGFRRNGRRRRYYRDGSDAVIMWANDLSGFQR